MKPTTTFLSLLLLLAPAGAAHAVDMVAGPLTADASTRCSCEIVNITTSTKTVKQILLVGADGSVLAGTELALPLPAGNAFSFTGESTGMQYCRFVNASPAVFRAAIACSVPGSADASDRVALPAR